MTVLMTVFADTSRQLGNMLAIRPTRFSRAFRRSSFGCCDH